MKHLLSKCETDPRADFYYVPLSWEDVEMLAGLAREVGLGYDSASYSATILLRAIAKGFFTVVREYEQTFEGIDVVLSPSQWEHWTETGRYPAVNDRLELIQEMKDRLGKLEKQYKDMLR